MSATALVGLGVKLVLEARRGTGRRSISAAVPPRTRSDCSRRAGAPSAATDVQPLPDPARSRAVLIGASTFDHLPPLPAVRNNLVDLRATLTDPEHGVIAPGNCEIVDGPDTPRAFMAGLRKVVGRTDDLLLVYYAGHGLRHDFRDELYLTVGLTDADALDESAVPFRWVKDVLEDSPARTNLLVLDCCYSGMALGTMSGVALEQREIEVRGSAVLASSPKNKKSHSPVGHRNTAFTGKMISLLENGSPNAGEPLTVNSLYKRISAALLRDELPGPKLKLTDTSGDLLLRRPKVTPRRWPEPPTEPRIRPALPTSPRVPAGPPPPAPEHRRWPPPAWQPPTVAQMPPGTHRPPHEEAPAGRVTQQVRVRSLQLLWMLTGLFVAMGLGGVFGVVVGEKQANGSVSAGSILGPGFLLAAMCGTALVLLRRHWGDLGQSDVAPLLGRSIAGRVTLLVGLVFFVLMAIVGPLTSTSADDSPSTEAAAVLIMVECAAACGYLLQRGRRLRGGNRR